MTEKQRYEKPSITTLGSVESLTLAQALAGTLDGAFLHDGQVVDNPVEAGDIAMGSL